MITVEFIKPFYTKVREGKIRLQFAYQYLTIKKDDEVFQFIPIEGKEMVINPQGRHVENLSEVFVFQRGNRFIRLPLYQLLLVSNMNEFLTPIIDEAVEKKHPDVLENNRETDVTKQDVQTVLSAIEQRNIDYLIDLALEEKNEEKFYELVKQKKSH